MKLSRVSRTGGFTVLIIQLHTIPGERTIVVK